MAKALWHAFRASRLWRWGALAGAGVLAFLLALSRAERRGAKAQRDEIEGDTYEHIIDRHDTREMVEDTVRRDDADAVREQLRTDGRGPRPRD